MNQLRLLLGVLLMCGFAVLQAQTITGTITDQAGEALIGASILVEGTTAGTVTDLEGNFEITPPANSENLLISYTGFSSKTVPLTGATFYDIVLEEDSETLDAVVVTGYGTQTRRRLTTAIASVGAEELAGQPVTSFTDALQGRLAGVNINTNAGTIGAQTSILVRGVGSINGSTQPLYVIDGVIIDSDLEGVAFGGPGTSPLNNINPADIESIDILKDAGAAAIYGSRGANGVVLITTKKGNFNQPAKFSLNQQVGFSEPTKQYDLLTGPEYANFWNQATRASNPGSADADLPLFDDPDNQPDADWLDLVTRTGSFSETNASISGGTSDLTYFMSAGYRDEKGWVKRTDFQRYAFNMSINKRFGDRFNVGIKLNPTRTVNNRQNEDNNVASPQTFGALARPTVEPFDENGNIRGGSGIVQFPGTPLANLEFQDISLTTTSIISNAFASFSPIERMTFRTNFGVQQLNLTDAQREGILTTGGSGSQGAALAQQQESLTYTWTTTGNYLFEVGRSEFDVLLGFETNRNTLNTFFVDGNTFADDRLRTLNSAAEITDGGGIFTESNFLGYFSQINYQYDRLNVKGTVRYDGSSRFGTENQFGWFPSLSAAYDFTDLISSPSVSQLKLRGGYGITGNAEIGNFASRGLVEFGNDYNGIPGFQLNSLDNVDLTWEESATADIGIDFELFSSKLTGSLGYYIRNSSQLLFDVPQPLTSGVGAEGGAAGNPVLTLNAGEIVNQGLEFNLTYNVVRNQDVQWSINVNGATLDNEVTELVDNDGDGNSDDIVVGRHLIREGEPLGTWFMTEYAGVDPANGDALFFNADGEITSAFTQGDARRLLGNSLPTFSGGFGSDVVYKGFDARVFFQFSAGNEAYLNEGRFIANNLGATWNQTRDQLDAWRPDNTDTNIPEARRRQNGGQHSSRYLSDASFIRLRNAQIGYTFNDLDSDGASLRLYLSGQNLLTFTDFAGLDPEASGQDNESWRRGDIFFSRPQSRFVTFGLNLNL